MSASSCQIEFTKTLAKDSKAIYLVTDNDPLDFIDNVPQQAWIKSNAFCGKLGQFLLLPNEIGEIQAALFGLGHKENVLEGDRDTLFITAKLCALLPNGSWHFALSNHSSTIHNFYSYLALSFGSYHFSEYQNNKTFKKLSFFVPDNINFDELNRQATATHFVRHLINMPANAMGPDKIEEAVQNLGQKYQAKVHSIIGEDLLLKNFPLIHAVGRASAIAPRLIELSWGNKNHKKLTLIGKGVAFDTGGLDIKTPNGMVLMKKDMGGAANILGLAQLIMDAKLPFFLKVLIPAVENSIAGNAFRPSDILKSRKGLTVEIGNTDAEGRLILADALSYGDEGCPDYMFDMATLTGAARVALGPDLPPFYCDNQDLANKITDAARITHDPLWQMPLWKAYNAKLFSPIADLNNVSNDSFAGSILAALFLQNFVDNCKNFVHFDIFGWTPSAKPGFPKGGEAQGIRALYHVLKNISLQK